MKRYMILLMSCLYVLSSQAMDLNNVFETLKEVPSATKVKLGPTAMFFARAITKTYGVKSVEVVTLEDCQQNHLDELVNSLDSNEFPEHDKLVSVNDEGEDIRIFTRIDEKYIREMFIFVVDTDITTIRIRGKIDPAKMVEITDDYAE